MIYKLFTSVLNMGLTASVAILAVLLARAFLGRLPKKNSYSEKRPCHQAHCVFPDLYMLLRFESQDNDVPEKSSELENDEKQMDEAYQDYFSSRKGTVKVEGKIIGSSIAFLLCAPRGV